MIKNVTVVDEQGNEYGATYPKRAKGLVKNGRARFIDENKICLACPPNEFLEDKMNENINTQATEINETTEANETNETAKASLYTMDYCLKQIEKIQAETSYIHEALSELSKVHSGGPGDVGAQGKAIALGEVVKCRETTNQKLLDFYFKMYENLRASTFDVVTQAQKDLAHIGDLMADYCCEDDARYGLVEIAELIKDLAEKAMKN